MGTLIVVTVWWNYSHFHGNFCELDPKAMSTPHKRLPWQKPKPALWEEHASSRKNFSEPAVCERSGQPSAHGSVAAQVDVHGGQRHFSAEPAHQSVSRRGDLGFSCRSDFGGGAVGWPCGKGGCIVGAIRCSRC